MLLLLSLLLSVGLLSIAALGVSIIVLGRTLSDLLQTCAAETAFAVLPICDVRFRLTTTAGAVTAATGADARADEAALFYRECEALRMSPHYASPYSQRYTSPTNPNIRFSL